MVQADVAKRASSHFRLNLISTGLQPQRSMVDSVGVTVSIYDRLIGMFS
jgi:hypothetical protein